MSVATLTTDDSEARAIGSLLDNIYHSYGYDCRKADPKQLKRQLKLLKEGHRLDSAFALQFLEGICRVPRLSIDRKSKYQAFRKHVIPFLRTFPSPKIWYAGCDSAEEVMGMAILLKQSGFPRFQIYATDLNETQLITLEKASFDSSVLAHWSIVTGKRKIDPELCTVRGKKITVRKSVKKHIFGFQHNLATDGSFNEFPAIVCTDNKIGHFGQSLKDRVYGLFHESLPLTGYLSLPNRKALDGTALQTEFLEVDAKNGLYKKIR